MLSHIFLFTKDKQNIAFGAELKIVNFVRAIFRLIINSQLQSLQFYVFTTLLFY